MSTPDATRPRTHAVTRTPFAMVPLWVYRHDEVTPTVMQVYLALATRTYERKVSKNLATLMSDSGLRRSAIYEAVAVLRRAGAVEERGDGWFLPIDPPSTTVESDTGPSATVDDVSAGADGPSTTVDAHLSSLETSYSQVQLERASTDPLDGFEAFWQAYPRKTAKGDARKAWPAAVKAAGGTGPIIAGALAYAADPNRDASYTAHASTWLRAERWSDPPLPPRRDRGNGKANPAKVHVVDDDREAPGGRLYDF